MVGRLEGKVALVTGGSSGMGKSTAIAFANEGAKVVVAARRVKEGEETVTSITDGGGKAIFIQTDVSQATDVENMVNATIETYGQLDCAFNNAGMNVPGPTHEVAKQGIRINAICPGLINTPPLKQAFDDPKLMERLVGLEPIGHVGEPSEIAETVVWLCSHAASFVTGHAMPVDGGMVSGIPPS